MGIFSGGLSKNQRSYFPSMVSTENEGNRKCQWDKQLKVVIRAETAHLNRPK